MSAEAATRRLELAPTAWPMALARACGAVMPLARRPPHALETSDAAWVAALAAPQAVPRLPHPRDASLRRLAVASLAAHAIILLAFVWPWRQASAPQREVSVELVQEPRPKPSSKPAQTPAPKPAPTKQAHQPPAKAARRPPPPKSPAQGARHTETKPGPMPARVLPGQAEAGDDAVAYPQLVLSKLAKAKKEGRYMGVPGYAAVAFHIGDDGSLASVSLVRPSGDPTLDAEAVAMIKRGAPYPPPPPGGRRDYAITLMFTPTP